MKKQKQRKQTEFGREQISLWVMSDDLTQADAIASRMALDRRAAEHGKVTRSTVLRIALSRGLEVLAKEYPG